MSILLNLDPDAQERRSKALEDNSREIPEAVGRARDEEVVRIAMEEKNDVIKVLEVPDISELMAEKD